jgi:hypothetical protein
LFDLEVLIDSESLGESRQLGKLLDDRGLKFESGATDIPFTKDGAYFHLTSGRSMKHRYSRPHLSVLKPAILDIKVLDIRRISDI